MQFPNTRLIIFAKAPEPGEVKTRLIPMLGKQGAADLYVRMASQIIRQACEARICPVELWCSPSIDHAFFSSCAAAFDLTLYAQSTGDLGERMAGALGSALGRSSAVIIIGTDCPGLRPADLQQAAVLLRDGADVVIGPAEDAGYYLLGMHEVADGLFSDIRWGGPDVLAITRQRLSRLGLNCRELATRWDVDRPEDVERLLESGLFVEDPDLKALFFGVFP